MKPKIILIVLGTIAFLVVIGAVGWKLVGKTEGYKSGKDQNFYSFEPHPFIGGCFSYKVMADKKALPKVEK